MGAILKKCPRSLAVLAAILIFGSVRLPVETSLRADLVESHLLQPPPARTALSALSQGTLMGTLGGLRSMVAVYLVLQAYEHFGLTEWGELSSVYNLITSLEPREEFHWAHWIWHIGINAPANVELDRKLPDQERKELYDFYTTEAIRIGERALKQLPESVEIRSQMAEVYKEKLRDHCGAAKMYGEMIDLPGRLSYVIRFHGYELAKCPGREREAYQYLMGLYLDTVTNLDKAGQPGFIDHRLPTLIATIKELEEFLEIPLARRIPDPHPDEARRRRPSTPRFERLPGGVGIP